MATPDRTKIRWCDSDVRDLATAGFEFIAAGQMCTSYFSRKSFCLRTALARIRAWHLQQVLYCYQHQQAHVMGQDVIAPPSMNVDNTTLDVFDQSTHLGLTVASKTSQDAEMNMRLAKTADVVSKLTKIVWGNINLTENTEPCVIQARVLSTLLYSSEVWTT